MRFRIVILYSLLPRRRREVHQGPCASDPEFQEKCLLSSSATAEHYKWIEHFES